MEISEFTPSTQADPSTLPEEQFPTAKTSNDPATSLPSEILPSDDATFMSANRCIDRVGFLDLFVPFAQRFQQIRSVIFKDKIYFQFLRSMT